MSRASSHALAPRLILLAGLCTSASVSAQDNVLHARIECQPRPTPGRVLCEAELEVETGVLRWADVLVLEAPAFAPPLRARVGPSALFVKTDQRQRLQLALAATEPGTGMLEIRARGVHCPDASGRNCRPVVREASATVSVGSVEP
jgi:hypothetical protein